MARMQRLRPMLVVADMEATLAYWTGNLGFRIGAELRDGDEPPYWANVVRDDVMVMFSWQAPHTHDDGELHVSTPALAGSLYLNVDDARAVHAELEAAGARPLGPPVDQPWGLREVTVEDPNGFTVIFGQDLNAT